MIIDTGIPLMLYTWRGTRNTSRSPHFFPVDLHRVTTNTPRSEPVIGLPHHVRAGDSALGPLAYMLLTILIVLPLESVHILTFSPTLLETD